MVCGQVEVEPQSILTVLDFLNRNLLWKVYACIHRKCIPSLLRKLFDVFSSIVIPLVLVFHIVVQHHDILELKIFDYFSLALALSLLRIANIKYHHDIFGYVRIEMAKNLERIVYALHFLPNRVQ